MKKITLIILIVLILAVAIICIRFPWTFKMEYETRNAKDYSKCLRLVDNLLGVTEVFPKEVPSNATDITFWCYNNLGGTKLELDFTATADEIKDYLQKATENGVSIGMPEKMNHGELVWITVNEETNQISFNAEKY
ncbi:MAG: hypothetical protein Q4E99_01025 [Bacillota bacterium]|nr:hypothetical protein [Bacillota bacterium]